MATVDGSEYVLPLYCLGDSHTEALSGLVLRDARTGEPVAVGVSMYAIPTAASMMTDAGGAIAGSLIPLLYAIRLLHFTAPDAAGPTFGFDGRTFGVHPYAQRRWVMLFAGELDARNVINAVPPGAVVGITDVDGYPFDVTGAQRIVTQDAIAGALGRALAPLFALVEQLRAIGIARVALTSVPPPTLDDAAYRALTGIDSRAPARYAVTMLLNRTVARWCAEHGVAFVDTWPDETDGNVVRPGFLYDDLHLGRAGARIKLQAYYDLVAERTEALDVAPLP